MTNDIPLEELKPNSNKYKKNNENKNQVEKRAEKIVSGSVKVKKKNALQKMSQEFISEEARNVKSYVVSDIFIPALKKLFYDIIVNGSDMILFGKTGGGAKRSTSEKISYRNYYDSRDNRYNYREPMRRNSYSYEDYELSSRREAEEVLNRMDEIMAEYGLVRVADLKDLLGISGDYTDNKFGWNNIRNAEIVNSRGGWVIKMPRAIPID